MTDYQVDRLIARLERAARITTTMHRLSRSRFAGDDAAQLRAHAGILTATAKDAISLLRTLDQPEGED